MTKNDVILVRLPRVAGIEEDFYGIGYHSDSGFIFTLITPEIMNKFPRRMFPFPKDTGYLSEYQYEVIGKIVTLPKIKKDKNEKN